MVRETYSTKAIVLKREAFRETDTRVIFYSEDQGKLELVARGTKKISSKLAGHLEPFNLVELMVVPGKQWDYVGTARNERAFAGIKADLTKLALAGEALAIFNKIIKAGIADCDIFFLLNEYLVALDALRVADGWQLRLASDGFILKLLSRLGYRPELKLCVNCGGKVANGSVKFSARKGGTICVSCVKTERGELLTLSEKSYILLNHLLASGAGKNALVKSDELTAGEINKVVSTFYKYHFV